MYLYRAVDSDRNTIDFFLSKTRDAKKVKHLLKKALAFSHVARPRVITVDKNIAYPVSIQQLKNEKQMPEGTRVRQIKYLNNIVEQNYRFIKKCVRCMLGFKSYQTDISILRGIEAMHMIKKRQINSENQSVQNQKKFIHQVFDLIV